MSARRSNSKSKMIADVLEKSKPSPSRPAFQLRFSDSDIDYSDSIESISQKTATDDEESSLDQFHLTVDSNKPPVPALPVSNLRMLDRYLPQSSRSVSKLQIPILSPRTQHFTCFRKHARHGALRRILFQLTSSHDNSVIAGAEFASAVSKVIEVSNSRGLVCEISLKDQFTMLLGSDPVMVLTKSAGRAVTAEFIENDGNTPPYQKLYSPPHICDHPATAFGTRKAIQSIKNCKLCNGEEEVVSVRKVSKNAVEIDAKHNVSFLNCFVIAIFMFLSK